MDFFLSAVLQLKHSYRANRTSSPKLTLSNFRRTPVISSGMVIIKCWTHNYRANHDNQSTQSRFSSGNSKSQKHNQAQQNHNQGPDCDLAKRKTEPKPATQWKTRVKSPKQAAHWNGKLNLVTSVQAAATSQHRSIAASTTTAHSNLQLAVATTTNIRCQDSGSHTLVHTL